MAKIPSKIDIGSNMGPDEDEAPVVAAAPAKPAEPPRVTIILDDSDDIPPTGLFVNYNGRAFMIRPGFEVTVPRGVVEILQHAITLSPVVDPNTRRFSGVRPRPRFGFRYVRHNDGDDRHSRAA